MPDDRDLPGIPNRNRIPTRPERKPTVKVAVPPPGPGNRVPRPELDETLDSARSARDGYELLATDADRRAEEAERAAREAQDEAEALRAELRREKRKSRPEPDSVPPRSRDLERLEARFDGKLADIAKEVAELRASQRSETTKVLVGAVVSIVLAVGGNRVIDAQGKPPPQIVVRRTEYDQKLEVCLAIKDDAAQVACLQRIVAEQADLRPK